MSKEISIKRITVLAAGGTYTINATDPFEEYVIVGSATLVGNLTVTTSGTPASPCTIRIKYKATLTSSLSFLVSIFGNVLNNQQALSGNIIVDATWDGVAWQSWIVDAFVGFNYEGFRTVPVNLAGATITLTNLDKQVQYFTGSGALAGNYNVTFSGTFREGQIFWLKVPATLTLGAFTLTFFGETINSTTAAGGNYLIWASYDLLNTTFRTQLIAFPPSAGGLAAPIDLAVPAIGINYPAASAGDTFRLVCASEEGRIGAIGTVLPYPEPPLCKRVFNGQQMICLATNGGGVEAAVGTSFWIPDFPTALVPIDTTNGTGSSNYRINIPGNPSAPNSVGLGTNVGNVMIGQGNGVSGSSVSNILVGNSISLTGSSFNVVTGSSQTLQTGASGHLIGGFLSNINGDNDIVNGTGHDIDGSNVSVIGDSHQADGATPATVINGMVLGEGGQIKITNSLVLGATSNPAAFGGKGVFQSFIVPLAGLVDTVIHPALQSITMGTSISGSVSMNYNSMVWGFEGSVVVAQKTVGALHTNTSTAGDWVEFVFSGVAKRNGGGTLSLSGVKFLDHRNRWIPLAAPNAIAYRNISVTDGTRADVCLVRPTITVSGSNILINIFCPGFATAVTDQGAARTPRYAVYLAAADVPLPSINAGAASDGVIQNTITVAAAPITTATFRNPYVDIFDGSDANGSGYYGGSGFGATATAETTTTGIVDIGIFSGGSYTGAATVSFTFGDATATPIMSAQTNHIGNNVGFTAGNYTGVPNGTYAFTFAGGTGSGAAGYATIAGGIVTATTITNGGTGYTTGDIVTLTIPGALPVTTPAVFTPTLYYSVTGVTITAPGTLYRNTSDLSVTFAGAGIAQAIGSAQIIPTTVTTSGGATGSITVTSGGKGYGICEPTVAVMDAGGVNYEDGNGGSFRAEGTMIVSQLKYA